MLAGERRFASARRGGMTVLGKVAVPKPINLPSQKLENHGLDPNVEIVPKGSLSWGSRPSSSSASNPWGSSAVSPNADGTVSPHGRPSSGGGRSRPSTAGSDRHEPTWGPNSRPSSASGVITSNQSSITSSRPLSAETRPGSSHLSRFAEPVFDNSVAWGPNGTADKLSIPSKANDFSLSSGDFPTLGSEKDTTAKNSEPHDHSSHARPISGSGRTAPAKERNEMVHADSKNGTVDTWTRDGSPHAERWQGEPQQYVNPNVPPQHFDAWRGPPMNAPPGVWYRGPPPPAGPPYPPVPHGGFPMEPFPYYRPQIPPNLAANSQSGPPQGPGPRGHQHHHPRSGDFYRPQMPEPFMRPGMPMRPGFYPGPVPYDGYFGPPMGYNPSDHDISFMGMPPVYNMGLPQNPSELNNDSHVRGGVRGSAGNMFVSEHMDSIPPEESRGPYKVVRKRENERDDADDMEGENLEKSDQPRPPSFHKNEWGTDTRRRNEDMPSRRNIGSQGYVSESVILHSVDGPHASNEGWGSSTEVPQDIPAKPKDSSLIQKIEGLNAKVRSSDVRGDSEQNNNRLFDNYPNKGNPTIAFGSISATGDLDKNVLRGEYTSKTTIANPSLFSRQAHHRADHHGKGRSSNQDAADGWRKKPPFRGPEVAAASVSSQNVGHASSVPENHISVENLEPKNTSESLTPIADPADGQAQRARMRELAKQRAIELQKEEEERIREQRAKALAKLEELNRRTLAAATIEADGTEKTTTSVPEQEAVDGSTKPSGPAIDDSKHQVPSSGLDAKAQAVVTQMSENSQQEPVDQSLLSKQSVANSSHNVESKAASLGNDQRQKRSSHNKQKQSVHMIEMWVDKSTPVEPSKAPLVAAAAADDTKNLGSNAVAVPNLELSSNINSNILLESTQQRKRNNKSSKNKHKVDVAAASREGDFANDNLSTESRLPEFDNSDASTVLVTDGSSKDAMQPNNISSLPSEESHGRVTNQHKPSQHSRRMPRNPQANNRFHVGDVAVWAPVHKDEHSQDDDDVSLTAAAKSVNPAQTNLKSKRAEMERYVPKPVAKELAQQGSIINQSPSSPMKMEDTTDRHDSGAIPVSVSGDNKQQVKSHGAWKQRGPTELHHDQGSQQGAPPPLTSNLKKNLHKSTIQHQVPNPVSTETNVSHEWDPSDGWFMPEYPPADVTPVVKDQSGAVMGGKGKKPSYNSKGGQRNTAKNQNANFKDSISSTQVELENQTDRPVSSKENRSSHWQPKPQSYRGSGWSGGSQNANLEVKRVRPEEPVVAEYKNQEVRRERKAVSSRGRPHSPLEDEAPFEQQQQQQQHGFRKHGGQNNRSGGGQDDKRKHNNRDRQRQSLHYEYQPVGSNNNSSNKTNNFDAHADGSANAGSRYKERSSGQSRRGGSNFYGRQ